MEGTNFDALGRLTLPVKAADQLGLTRKQQAAYNRSRSGSFHFVASDAGRAAIV